MNIDSMDILKEALHLTEVHDPCPYLSDRISTLNVCRGALPGEIYRYFLDKGYRRNGMIMYRPQCHHCTECKILRIPVNEFKASKEQRRVWNRGNRLFQVKLATPNFSPEKLDLYRRYLAYQHNDPATGFSTEKYREFLVDSFLGGATLEAQVYAGNQLIGIGIFDQVADALSTVYFFFDPAFARYSPGTWSALYEIELAKRWGLQYYYFGFYIRECAAMNYKKKFKPCEIKSPDDIKWDLFHR